MKLAANPFLWSGQKDLLTLQAAKCEFLTLSLTNSSWYCSIDMIIKTSVNPETGNYRSCETVISSI